MADTRKDRRAPVSLKVRFKSATVDEFVEQYASDISRGGIFIKSKSPMPVGTLLKFEFQLKDESRLIHGVGRVVWKRDTAIDDESPPGMGIKFIKMDPASRQLVEQIVGQRGDQPGEFEQGAGKIRSAKKTEMFFPAPAPQSALPAPEDSTQVRHASEFLAEALALGDEDAAKEAAERADVARKRTEEIERQRSESAIRDKAEREARDRADREAAERERLEDEAAAKKRAEQNAAVEAIAFKAQADAGLVAIGSTDDINEDEATSIMHGAAAQLALDAELDELARTGGGDAAVEIEETARPKTGAPDVAVTAKSSSEPAKKPASQPGPRVSPPMDDVATEQPSSLALPLSIAAIVLLGVGGYFVYQQMNAGDTTELTTSANPPIDPMGGEDTALGEGTGDPNALAVEGEDVVDEEPAVMISVRVESNPRGATIFVGDEERGAAPLEVEVAQGREVEIIARQEGMVSARQTVTPVEGMAALRMELAPLPWIIVVSATPSDATISASGRPPNDLGEIALSGAPSGPVLVSANKAGFTRATERVLRTAFTQEGERMIAHLTIALEEQRRGGGRPTGTGSTGTTMASTTTMAGGDTTAAGDSTTTMTTTSGTTTTTTTNGGTTMADGTGSTGGDTGTGGGDSPSTMAGGDTAGRGDSPSTMGSTSTMSDIPDNPF